MRRLFLHIGSHKTGTTTVQDTLHANMAVLAERGLAVAEGPSMPNLHQYVEYANPAAILPGGYKTHEPVKFAKLLASEKSDQVFGSSENFSFFFQQAAVDALAAVLKARFDEIRIIAYLRRQDRHAISHHQEGARPNRKPEGLLWGHSLSALPEPAPQQRLYLDYDRRIGLWENAFGRDALRIRVFDRALLQDGDVVPDILALMGIDPAGLVRVPDSNLSLDRLMATVGHLANQALDDSAVTRKLLRALPQHEDRMAPSAAEAEAFLAPYREGNRRLNQRLKITDLPDLFPGDFSDYPEVASQELSHAEAIEGLRGVIAALGPGWAVLQSLTANDLRLAAAALQQNAPESALRLIQSAAVLRPTGPAIVKLLGELEVRLGKKNPSNEGGKVGQTHALSS